MKIPKFHVAALASGWCLLGLPSCEKAAPPPPAALSAAPAASRPVVVRMAADGLAYEPRTYQPFTGETTAYFPNDPSKMKRKEGYTKGIRDGDTVDYFSHGGIKQVQHFQRGLPVSAASWHENGQRETEVTVGVKAGAEGTFRRWNNQGLMEVEAAVDENVHWHGDYREWTPDGGLAAHYRYQHGVLRVILTETEAALAKRQAAGIPLTPRDEPVVPKAGVVPGPAGVAVVKAPAQSPSAKVPPALDIKPAAMPVPRLKPSVRSKSKVNPGPAASVPPRKPRQN
jgi:hypothetical protein